MHLLESGKTKLAENFIYIFKQFLLTISLRLFLESPTHGNIEHTYSQSVNTRNCESISTKSIINIQILLLKRTMKITY